MFCWPRCFFFFVTYNELASDILSAGSLVFPFLLLFLLFLFLSPELSAAMRTDDERIRSAAAVHMQVFMCVCVRILPHMCPHTHAMRTDDEAVNSASAAHPPRMRPSATSA